MEVLCLLLREPLLKKGLLSNSLPKTFSVKFPLTGRPANLAVHDKLSWASRQGKFHVKSLWKGVWGRTFPLYGVLNAVNMYGFSEEVILGDFNYAN